MPAHGKFDRVVELVVLQDTFGLVSYKIVNLTIEFRVQKFPDGAVDNRAIVTVYNLRSEVRDLLNKRRADIAEAPFTTVFLSAGHRRGGGAKLIFRGVVVNGQSSRSGPDWVTEFDAFTAHAQKTTAFCPADLTFRPTPPLVILNRLFALLNFGTPVYAPDALVVLSRAFPAGIAFSGKVDEAIYRFLKRYSLAFTLGDNGPLVVRVEGAADVSTPSKLLPVVSPETGLIGTPKITTEGVELRTILNAELRLFHRFRVVSETTSESLAVTDREFTCRKLEHVGSNRGEDFFTEVSGAFFPRYPFDAEPTDPPAAFTTSPIVVGA